MMKKAFLSLLCALMALTAVAQGYTAGAKKTYDVPPFGQGKIYVASSLSGLNLAYNSTEKWNLDVQAKAGYLLTDNFMLLAQSEYDYRKCDANSFSVGGGVRYYIEDNGLYFGAGANYVHQNHTYDDFMPTVQVGYTFFLNRTVALEPELYYNQSLKNHSDYSGFGLRVGIGIYFE